MKVIVANDTRIENHHGCSRVMNAIDRNLFCRNVEILRYVKLLDEWDCNENIKRDILQTDLVIINGEGTLHDDYNPYINRLLALIAFCKHYNLPVVVINATISNLSEKNLALLKQADAIYVRESCSYDYLRNHDIESLVVPDLTFWNADSFNNTQNDNASKIGYTDNVLRKSSAKMEIIAKEKKFEYLDIFNKNNSADETILTILQKKNLVRFLRKSFKKKIKQYFLTKKREKNGLYQKQNQVDFIANLNEYKFIFTGRYHMVCFCLIMKIPFFAVSSNTYKIEGLLSDVGLNPERLISPDKIDVDNFFTFNTDEMLNIETFLLETDLKINTMFDQILLLAEKK